MNHSYCLFWNDATQRYVPAPETARRRGKGRPGKSRAALALAPLALLLGALLALPAGAQVLPSGETLVSGATVQRDGHQMTIHQNAPKAILQWQSFDIGAGAKVQFNQPSTSAIALNRVMGGKASQIDGQLSANGQVWLVNPNGVVFGSGSRVDVGGLVASTLEITDADFEAGNRVFTRGPAKATGSITVQEGAEITVRGGAAQGLLALLAPEVKNEGTLRAQMGNVVVAGSDRVTLKAGANGQLAVVVDPATVRTLIENKGMIIADGGRVLMTARAADAASGGVVSNTGMVQARTLENRRGRIVLHGDAQHGGLRHSGLLDASAPHGGNGGFVETSAAQVQIAAGAQVTTQASAPGSTGIWAVGGKHLSIHTGSAAPAASGIDANALNANLANTSVTLKSSGAVDVNAAISYDRNHLVLEAENTLAINAPVSVKGTGRLTLNYGKSASDPFDLDAKFLVRAPIGFDNAGADRLRINYQPYEVINDLAGLQGINAEGRLGGNYALGRTIDANGTPGFDFEPIGKEGSPFTGSFDGLGHGIKNLSIRRPDRKFVGLFGAASNAVLRNVSLSRMQVEGSSHVGALVGQIHSQGSKAHIWNVRIDDTVNVSGKEFVGGLAGVNAATHGGTARISRSTSNGSVTGVGSVGGLVGANQAISGTAGIVDSSAGGGCRAAHSVAGW